MMPAEMKRFFLADSEVDFSTSNTIYPKNGLTKVLELNNLGFEYVVSMN